jgi:hypothetical protein
MAIDPNIALGVRQIELANPLAQYGQIAAIQNAQNQNKLAQFQLGAAERADLAQNALSEAYRKSLSPETGAIDSQALIRNLAASNAAHLIPDVQTKLLATEKERGLIKKTGIETEEKEFKLKNDKLNFAWNAVGSASTPQDAIRKITEGVKNGVFDMKGASTDIQQLQNMTPEQYQQYRVQKVMGILDAKDKLGFMLPKTRDRDIGGMIQTIQDNPALPGYGLPIAGGSISKTETIADNLAAAKFAFEKANPAMSIQEDPSGLLAVNTRTGVATPVVYGPTGFQAAPAAAPSASMMRQPPAALPSQRVAAIPGMTSVLDQTAAPLVAQGGERMPGMPVAGKGTALTESQGNATAYGMRMKEANAVLEPLEKAGKTNTGLIKGAVSGTVGLVPFIGEKLEDASGSIFNALPRVLGGLSPEQQQVAQARINFITALLRKESGAAIGASEFATAEKNYFPKPGDDAATIAQKQQARKTAIRAMEIQAGPGAKQMGGAGVISGATANNPLGLPGL